MNHWTEPTHEIYNFFFKYFACSKNRKSNLPKNDECILAYYLTHSNI